MDSAPDGHPQVRWMMSEDIEPVRSIEQDNVSDSWTSSRYLSELPHPASRYIVLDGAIHVSAFGGLWLGVDEVHVITMAVREANRRKGYGAFILRALLAVGADLGTAAATLECRTANKQARALYRKFGFVEVGERKAYYADDEDAVSMTTEEFDSPSYKARLADLDSELTKRFPGAIFMPRGRAPSARAERDD